MLKRTYLRNRLAFLSNLLQSKDRKTILKMTSEIITLTIRNKVIPNYYFSRRLYLKENKNILNYIPDQVLYGLHSYFNDPSSVPILKDKLYFNLFYSQFFKNLPRIIMYNYNNCFIIDNQCVTVNNAQTLGFLLQDLINNKSTSKSIFIKKRYDSWGGKNIYKISQKEIPLSGEYLGKLTKEILQSSYLFQETLIQHKEMNRLNPSCINSIRIDTFIDRYGKAHVIGPYVRMSIVDSYIDNVSSGGCAVGVDLDSGRLFSHGYTSISKTGGKTITQHPLTKVKFNEFIVPYFDEVKSFVLKLALLVPNLRLIGWDIAIGKKGPVLIEGNDRYTINNHDLVHGGYKTNKVFKEVLKEKSDNHSSRVI